MNISKNTDSYIRGFSKEIGDRLTTIRNLIKKIAPKAEETISYGMPAFRLEVKGSNKRHVFIYYAGFKNHIGLYPFPSTMRAFQKEASKYKTGPGTIQFPHGEKLPIGLITKIVRHRFREKLREIAGKNA